MGFTPFIVKNRFCSTVIGTFAVYLSIAFVTPLNNFSVYITSFIHMKQDFVTMHYGMFIHLIFSFGSTIANPIGGVLENYIGFLKTIYLGLLILLIGCIVFIYQQNIWLCYGLSLIMGMGTGVSTSLLGKNLVFYVPKKKGMLTGAIGIGAVIISAAYTFGGEKIINLEGYTLKNDELYYPEDISERTYIYFILGAISIPIGAILSIFFIHEYKPEFAENEKKEGNETTNESNEKKDNENEIIEKIDDENENNSPQKNAEQTKEEKKAARDLKILRAKLNVKQALKDFRFWRIAFISLFINFSISFIGNTGRTFGALIGIDGIALQFLMVLQAISFIIAGPVLGVIVDKKGPLVILRIVSIICIIPGIILAIFMDKTLFFVLAYAINVIGVSGILVGFGPLVMEIYGIQESVILGGIISGFSKISEITTTVTAFVVSIFYQQPEELKYPYRILYIISATCCLITAILLFFETNDKFVYNNEIPMTDEDPNGNNTEDSLRTIE